MEKYKTLSFLCQIIESQFTLLCIPSGGESSAIGALTNGFAMDDIYDNKSDESLLMSPVRGTYVLENQVITNVPLNKGITLNFIVF